MCQALEHIKPFRSALSPRQAIFYHGIPRGLLGIVLDLKFKDTATSIQVYPWLVWRELELGPQRKFRYSHSCLVHWAGVAVKSHGFPESKSSWVKKVGSVVQTECHGLKLAGNRGSSFGFKEHTHRFQSVVPHFPWVLISFYHVLCYLHIFFSN